MIKKNLQYLLSLKKENILITSVTSYDASFAKLADDCGVDIILVGDSLGEVIKGAKNTHSVTVDDICYHTKSVSKGIKYAYLISDMPKHSFRTKRQALSNAIKITEKGLADMIKIESTPKQLDIVKHLINNNIKVCGHIGIQPQNINKKSYRKIGITTRECKSLTRHALMLQDSGVKLIVAECIDKRCAEKISNILKIPLIGIGSGSKCDGQIRVIYDIFNISFNGKPGFLKDQESQKNPLKDILIGYLKSMKNNIN